MYSFGAKLKNLRERRGFTQEDLAIKLNERYKTVITKGLISKWEHDKSDPRMETVRILADFFNLTLDAMLELKNDNDNKSEQNYAIPVKGCSSQVPLYGSIAAGIPLEMISVEEYIEIPEHVARRYPDAFLLQVNGDSMNKIVPKGAYVLIDPCEEVANGEVAAITVNGYDATLKRFYKLQNTLVLEPDSFNPEHSAKSFDSNKDECESFKIIGKMVWFMSPFNVKY